jgi:hypothetical protein
MFDALRAVWSDEADEEVAAAGPAGVTPVQSMVGTTECAFG